MKCVPHWISRALSVALKNIPNNNTWRYLLWSDDQLELMQGGIVQAETCRRPAYYQHVNYLFYFAQLCNRVIEKYHNFNSGAANSWSRWPYKESCHKHTLAQGESRKKNWKLKALRGITSTFTSLFLHFGHI